MPACEFCGEEADDETVDGDPICDMCALERKDDEEDLPSASQQRHIFDIGPDDVDD
jgi:hypothetical protein